MGQISTLTLNDGQTTPVAHTFVPANPQSGSESATWYDKSVGTPLGYRKISLKVLFQPSGISRVKIIIADPILVDPSDGCCVTQNTAAVAYTDFAHLEFTVPWQSTQANRKDILAYAKNLLANAVVTSAVVDLEPVW